MQPSKVPSQPISEAEAERRADQADKDDAKIYYRREFTGPSLGTEEELSGKNIKMSYTSERLVGVVSKGPRNPLVLITRDMRIKAYGGDRREYTIELRTTPTEMPVIGQENTQWQDRTRALQVAIWAIENNFDVPLKDDEYGGFQTSIYNSDHSFVKPSTTATEPEASAKSAMTITDSNKQATIGVPTRLLLVSADDDARARGQLHTSVKLPWYVDQFTRDSAVTGLAPDERVAYAFLMSAALQLSRLPRDAGNGVFNPYTSEAKNAWKVRPRTPPVKILSALPPGRQQAVLTAVESSLVPAAAGSTTQENWTECFLWITRGHLLGGHEPMDITINAKPGMLFEYRFAPVEQYPDAFWKPGRWETSDF